MDVNICSWGKRSSEVENPDIFKKHLKGKKRSQWLEKPLHGISIKDRESEHRENVAMVEGRTS